MHKKIIIALILIFSFSLIYAQQSRKGKRADRLYSNFNYSKALSLYNELESDDINIIRKKAKCYKFLQKYDKAEELFSKLVKMEDKTSYDHYLYSYILRINEKYNESDNQLEIFHQLEPEDSRGIQLINNRNYLSKISKDEERYKISNMDFNSEAQEFGPAFYKNYLVFASTRMISRPIITRIYNRNNKPFLNLYKYDLNNESDENYPRHFWKKFNRRFHEGPAAFDKSGTFMAFTRNNYNYKSSDGARNLEIYFSEFIDGKWTKPIPFEYNNKEHSVGHPFLSDDGKTMYFASNMEGAIGETDIFVSYRKNDNSWTKPKNLGTPINTEGNEMFPFVTSEGSLIFASDGHLGLGGLDLFITDPKMSKVINMGAPLNTNADDFALILDNQMKKGYFSSNRKEGKGDDDIYYLEILKPFVWGKIIAGATLDNKGNILAKTAVKLYDNKGNIIEEIVTDESGKFTFNVEPNSVYQLLGIKNDYFDATNKASTITDKEVVTVNLILEKDPGLSLYGIVTDRRTKEKIENVKITISDLTTGKDYEFTTSKSGDFKKLLSDKRINDTGNYKFTLEKDGYFTKRIDYKLIFDKPGQYDLHNSLDLSMDKKVKDLTQLAQINPIYFDLNKSDIRPDAAVELDKIVEIMNRYPDMHVELASHTDCRGSAAYNLRLSDERARSSAAYIQKRITNPERIYGKGYGETQLLNHCECEGDHVVPCTEEEHQINRRTEFRVISTGSDKLQIID